ncbi:Zinc finger, C2H2 domain and Zinc finger, C2H2-like domain-containing protein [Strongyloides ratti]|uniref:Zinc finger, C2H2 domain and Zinc finger, C2H2-like domain-containing protein n=1 Tax=Strongyloides ratti TaxID=34506 RepID=A0A090MV02_STRRB|nr:Zinc finger, C2H2 domain and Zinc finger, C2H2-like domain-containing protein [Strongyloides ratti]CEF62558.1 Zinc finger, C2H2 domain and Zinc finger, C2H2-like domain-containing protein [Strongyloides ratti]
MAESSISKNDKLKNLQSYNFNENSSENVKNVSLQNTESVKKPLEEVINIVNNTSLKRRLHYDSCVDTEMLPKNGNKNHLNEVLIESDSISNIDDDFFKKTIFKIKQLSCNSDGTPIVIQCNESINAMINGKNSVVKIATNIKNKVLTCLKCKKMVNDHYLCRRNHVFEDHLNEIKTVIKEKMNVKKSDILFAGFQLIRSYFPEEMIHNDFQCQYCGSFFMSLSRAFNHIGSTHQFIYEVHCPFPKCNYKSGGFSSLKGHVKSHLTNFIPCDTSESLKSLRYHLSEDTYRKFITDCNIVRDLTAKLLKYCFPINMGVYNNFEKEFKKALGEFKRHSCSTCELDSISFYNDNEIQDLNKASNIEPRKDNDKSMIPQMNLLTRNKTSDNMNKKITSDKKVTFELEKPVSVSKYDNKVEEKKLTEDSSSKVLSKPIPRHYPKKSIKRPQHNYNSFHRRMTRERFENCNCNCSYIMNGHDNYRCFDYGNGDFIKYILINYTSLVDSVPHQKIHSKNTLKLISYFFDEKFSV